jgi:hypothetical protein
MFSLGFLPEVCDCKKGSRVHRPDFLSTRRIVGWSIKSFSAHHRNAPTIVIHSFDESLPPSAGLGLDGLAADEPSGAELRSPPADGKGFVAASAADPGGAELCSLAPVEVSAFPASSAANAGTAPSNKVRTRAQGIRLRLGLRGTKARIQLFNPVRTKERRWKWLEIFIVTNAALMIVIRS